MYSNSTSSTSPPLPILPRDLWINVGSFLVARDINNLSQSSSQMYQLYFGIHQSKGYRNRHHLPPPLDSSESEEYYSKEELERDDFAQVQEFIWKPLVLMCFAKFHLDLHIRNWFTLLKRRLEIIIKYHPYILPLGRSSIFNLQDTQFVENCSFIYKCPMDFTQLHDIEDASEGTKYCSLCESKVYKVNDAKDMKMRVGLGQCVYFSLPPPGPPPLHNLMMMGPPPPISSLTPPRPPTYLPPPPINMPK